MSCFWTQYENAEEPDCSSVLPVLYARNKPLIGYSSTTGTYQFSYNPSPSAFFSFMAYQDADLSTSIIPASGVIASVHVYDVPSPSSICINWPSVIWCGMPSSSAGTLPALGPLLHSATPVLAFTCTSGSPTGTAVTSLTMDQLLIACGFTKASCAGQPNPFCYSMGAAELPLIVLSMALDVGDLAMFLPAVIHLSG